jgi:tyramine---L-glutamate ligase
LLFAQIMRDAGISHPKTWTLDRLRYDDFCTSPSAFTLKRRDGAGCADMKWFPTIAALATWVSSNASLVDPNDDWIIQPWHTGQAMSVAVIAGHAPNQLGMVLEAMEQAIELVSTDEVITEWRVEYRGSRLPVNRLHPNEVEAFVSVVLSSMQTDSEQQGWIGIDFVVPADAKNWRDWIVIEVNPRLTSSYLVYRNIYGAGLADAIMPICY